MMALEESKGISCETDSLSKQDLACETEPVNKLTHCTDFTSSIRKVSTSAFQIRHLAGPAALQKQHYCVTMWRSLCLRKRLPRVLLIWYHSWFTLEAASSFLKR